MLKIENLEAYYGDVRVLKGVSLEVKPDSLVTLLGANGAGKSTLIRSISGTHSEVNGTITFGGERLTGIPPFKRVDLGLVQIPEGRMLFPHMSVMENLELGAYSARARRDRKQSLAKVLDIFPILGDRKNQLAGTLSGGQQQMCAIGRGLMAKPKMIMLDEPTLGLAPLMVKETFEIIRTLQKNRITILLVEQNVHQSLKIAEKAYVLETGEVVLEGECEELLTDDRLKKAYMGI